jgi:hypothetical protein
MENCFGAVPFNSGGLFHASLRSKPTVLAILNVLAALALIYPAAKIDERYKPQTLNVYLLKMALVSFACIATDSLIRIFLWKF